MSKSQETALKELTTRFGQNHLLQFWDRLDTSQRDRLGKQIEAIDFELLDKLFRGEDVQPDWNALAARAEPPNAIRLGNSISQAKRKAASDCGETALRSGKVGVILVAGGQGTRLGFDQPKGMFPIGPLSNRTLFEMHIDRLRAVMRRYDVSITLFVMTSPATDRDTRAFLNAHQGFGLKTNQLRIFCQGTMPAIDKSTGKVLLNSRDEIAISPDGHGGLLSAMSRNGCLEDASKAGIDTFFYAQIDNPLVQLCDPSIIGHHLVANSEMTTQVVRKTFPLERVGNVVQIDGKTNIIEYSDLPKAAAEQRDSRGELKLWAGNIAVHVFDRRFLQRVLTSLEGLPFHRAKKAVPYLDSDGNRIEPTETNAIKFEKFVFDLLPLAASTLVVEGLSSEVFAPVKNAEGAASDTPSLVKNSISTLHREWLTKAGAKVDEHVTVEINPVWALDAEEASEKIDPNTTVNRDTYFH